MTEETSLPLSVLCGDTTPRDRRNLRRMLLALLVWAVCFVGVTYSLKRELIPAGPISWAAAVLPTLLAITALFAYGRYLREADELQRVIHLRALALGFGATWVAMCGYPLIERLGAPAADTSDYVMVMAASYSLSIVLGQRRFW